MSHSRHRTTVPRKTQVSKRQFAHATLVRPPPATAPLTCTPPGPAKNRPDRSPRRSQGGVPGPSLSAPADKRPGKAVAPLICPHHGGPVDYRSRR
jgi:hypothetical protein